jgi:hypothetical protein
MSDDDSWKRKSSPPPDFPALFPLEKIQSDIAGMLGGVIDAMGKDAEQLLKKNGASQTHTHAASRDITMRAITMLGDLVRNAMPAASARKGPAENARSAEPESDNLSQVP